MALEALAQKGHYFHIYDFRVKRGRAAEFIRLFDEFDHSDINPMHKSAAQVKDGVMCQDVNDPEHFYLIGEWRDVQEHARILKILAEQVKPEFVTLIEDLAKGAFKPVYAKIVSSTPQAVLDKAAAS